MRYPADPPTVEELVAVMRAAGEKIRGQRLRARSWSISAARIQLRATAEAARASPAAASPRARRETAREGVPLVVMLGHSNLGIISVYHCRFAMRGGAESALEGRADQAARCSHEAVPSQVWGFRSQHQPSFGLPSLIQNAGTRWSPRREPAIEKPQFLAMTSGC
jgi:hypothetical protein